MSGADISDCGADCQEALAQLERYLDGELPNATLEDVKAHLQACYPCTDRASFEELEAAVAEVLNELPVTQRAVVELRSLGHNLSEVADMLDTTVAANTS